MRWRERVLGTIFWAALAWCVYALIFQRSVITGMEALLCQLGTLDAANRLMSNRPVRKLSGWIIIWALNAVPSMVTLYALFWAVKPDRFATGMAVVWTVMIIIACVRDTMTQPEPGLTERA